MSNHARRRRAYGKGRRSAAKLRGVVRHDPARAERQLVGGGRRAQARVPRMLGRGFRG